MRIMLSKHGFWRFVDGNQKFPNDENEMTNYSEIFTFVTKFVLICCIIASTINKDMKIYQMDVNCDLENDIYME